LFNKKVAAAFIVLFVLLFNTHTTFAQSWTTVEAPSGLIVTSVTGSGIDLSWSPSQGASCYKVYMASSYDSNYKQIATTSQPAYKAPGLKGWATYWFFMRGYNLFSSSYDSTHIKAVTAQFTGNSQSKIILGFATKYTLSDKSSYDSLAHYSSMINEVATFTYAVDGMGNIKGTVPLDQISYANSKGIATMAMIANNFDGSIAKSLLENGVNRRNLINNILSELRANNYKGVNIDLEGIYYYNRGHFTQFMNELYNTLNPLGYKVTVDVPAKTGDIATNSWSGAFDYKELSKYADRIVLMAYDEHYFGGQPGPVASINWVQSVVNYALTVIPKDKIMLGVAAYGYDWSARGSKAYSISGAYNTAAKYGSQVMWDPISQSPYFNYKDDSGIAHTVWFENNMSVGYKLDVVNNSGLSGIAIWRLGLENGDYWTTIRNKFN